MRNSTLPPVNAYTARGMLAPLAPGLWHVQHAFRFSGLDVTTRMTVVLLEGGRLWLHSPVPLTAALARQLDALGTVAYVVAPSKSHHLYIGDYFRAYPDAGFFCAPGLQAKRRDLGPMRVLADSPEPEWRDELDQTRFHGMPVVNEVVWFHRATRTLIVTDLCQWMRGNLSLPTALFARATGVRRELAMPRSLKMFVSNKAAARESCERILAWPFERVIMAHDSIVDSGAHAAVERAFAWLER